MRCLHPIFMLAVMVIVLCSAGLNPGMGEVKAQDRFQKVIYSIDFSDYHSGPIDEWLKQKAFEFQRDARNRKKLHLDVGDEGLILEAKRPMFGMLVNDGVDLDKFSSIRLEWGVHRYPEGASYERGIRNEALMVIVFFGYDKVSCGHFLIPDAPYFIGFFLGREEEIKRGYVGQYCQKSGRYVCLGNPQPGETVVSEYNLASAFKSEYEKEKVPLISGVALSIDTSKSEEGGKAAAFIKSIKFLE